MNKFTLLLEMEESQKYFKVKSELDLAIEASSEGEASYISDLTLSSVDGQSGYNIKNIEEIDKIQYNELMIENYAVVSSAFSAHDDDSDDWDKLSDREKALRYWDTMFGDNSPTTPQKLEYYHNMRTAGVDAEILSNILSGKLLGKI